MNRSFLYVPSIIPHAELVAPEAYMDRFRGKLLPETSFEGTDAGEGYRTGAYAVAARGTRGLRGDD